jgi:hypothetical protein
MPDVDSRAVVRRLFTDRDLAWLSVRAEEQCVDRDDLLANARDTSRLSFVLSSRRLMADLVAPTLPWAPESCREPGCVTLSQCTQRRHCPGRVYVGARLCGLPTSARFHEMAGWSRATLLTTVESLFVHGSVLWHRLDAWMRGMFAATPPTTVMKSREVWRTMEQDMRCIGARDSVPWYCLRDRIYTVELVVCAENVQYAPADDREFECYSTALASARWFAAAADTRADIGARAQAATDHLLDAFRRTLPS